MNRNLDKPRKKEIPLPPHKYEPPCWKSPLPLERAKPGKIPTYHNALPRDSKFAYMTPGYYATGFKILDVYKTEMDFTDIRRLLFLERDEKWANLRRRIPYPVGRVTDLPGTRDLKYNNYCLRNLTPESAASWRKSIVHMRPHNEVVCQGKAEDKNEDN